MHSTTLSVLVILFFVHKGVNILKYGIFLMMRSISLDVVYIFSIPLIEFLKVILLVLSCIVLFCEAMNKCLILLDETRIFSKRKDRNSLNQHMCANVITMKSPQTHPS